MAPSPIGRRGSDTLVDRLVYFGRPRADIDGVEGGDRATRAMTAGALLWACGFISFTSISAREDQLNTASAMLYLSLGPMLLLGIWGGRRTGRLVGIVPLATIVWVSLLGTTDDLYRTSTPMVAIVLCATFVSWMGTRVAMHYVLATLGGVVLAGLIGNDPVLLDRMIFVAFSTVFIVLVVGRRADEVARAAAEREVLLDRLAHETRHDSLTTLGNRTHLVEELEAMIAERDTASIGLALIDLDQFKQINDDYGHLVGDEVLIELGRRLREFTLTSGTAARIGGDEFALLLPDPTSGETAMAEELEQALSWSWEQDGETAQICASVGASIRHTRDISLETLFSAADRAMYDRKGMRQNRRRSD